MSPIAVDLFNAFVSSHRRALQRIGRATRGECQFEDIVNEAWLMIEQMGGERELADPAFGDRVLAHLYQRLVRYTDRTVRFATRLDHNPGNDDDSIPHPIMAMLASDQGRHPLTELLAIEEGARQLSQEQRESSQMSAWLVLLRQHDFQMRSLAAHLLISVSYAYRRRAHARKLVICQNALPFAPPDASGLGPWRRYRFNRVPQQLQLQLERLDGLPGMQS